MRFSCLLVASLVLLSRSLAITLDEDNLARLQFISQLDEELAKVDDTAQDDDTAVELSDDDLESQLMQMSDDDLDELFLDKLQDALDVSKDEEKSKRAPAISGILGIVGRCAGQAAAGQLRSLLGNGKVGRFVRRILGRVRVRGALRRIGRGIRRVFRGIRRFRIRRVRLWGRRRRRRRRRRSWG